MMEKEGISDKKDVEIRRLSVAMVYTYLCFRGVGKIDDDIFEDELLSRSRSIIKDNDLGDISGEILQQNFNDLLPTLEESDYDIVKDDLENFVDSVKGFILEE
jgi:hypothetical protein